MGCAVAFLSGLPLSANPGGNTGGRIPETYGFYAQGDYRPIDSSGKSIEELNGIAPLQLAKASIVAYVELRLCFELSRHARVASVLARNIEVRSQNAAEVQAHLDSGDPAHSLRPAVEVFNWQTDHFSFSGSAELYYAGNRQSFQFELGVSLNGELSFGQLSPIPSEPIGDSEFFSISVNFPVRTLAPLIDVVWQLLNDYEEYQVRNELKKYLFLHQADSAVLRKADLAWYCSFKLLEICELSGNRYLQSYALMRVQNGAVQLRLMNGLSTLLHEVNAIPSEFVLNNETADGYLRFFCWAVQAKGGSFYVPRFLREVPLHVPDERQKGLLLENLRILKAQVFGVFPVSDVEAEKLNYQALPLPNFRRRAFVAYLSSLFEAWFVIHSTGLVEMVYDEPKAADLPIIKGLYGGDHLIVLHDLVAPNERRPETRHFSDPPDYVTSNKASRQEKNVAELDALLSGEKPIAGLCITGPVSLDSAVLTSTRHESRD